MARNSSSSDSGDPCLTYQKPIPGNAASTVSEDRLTYQAKVPNGASTSVGKLTEQASQKNSPPYDSSKKVGNFPPKGASKDATGWDEAQMPEPRGMRYGSPKTDH